MSRILRIRNGFGDEFGFFEGVRHEGSNPWIPEPSGTLSVRQVNVFISIASVSDVLGLDDLGVKSPFTLRIGEGFVHDRMFNAFRLTLVMVVMMMMMLLRRKVTMLSKVLLSLLGSVEAMGAGVKGIISRLIPIAVIVVSIAELIVPVVCVFIFAIGVPIAVSVVVGNLAVERIFAPRTAIGVGRRRGRKWRWSGLPN